MSELKLQQAVLERENLELRASHFNNNTIATDRRLPPVPNARIRTNSSSGSMVTLYRGHFDCEILKWGRQTRYVQFSIDLFTLFSLSFHRHHRQHIVVNKLIYITIVFREHQHQPHQRQYNRHRVRPIIRRRSIQMQILNEMRLHSVNNL